MAYQGNKKKIRFDKSVGFALEGIKASWSERNVKIQWLFAVFVVIAGFVFSISQVEWLFLLSCIAGVIALELVNTAIETTVDLVTEDIQILAKKAKDIAAGAVLVYTIYSILVGMIIFLPKILGLSN